MVGQIEGGIRAIEIAATLLRLSRDLLISLTWPAVYLPLNIMVPRYSGETWTAVVSTSWQWRQKESAFFLLEIMAV